MMDNEWVVEWAVEWAVGFWKIGCAVPGTRFVVRESFCSLRI